MADTKTTALTAATSWASGDLLYLVRDPAGTPVSRKITIDNILQNLVCAANTSLIKSTSGYSLTGSNASSMIDLAGTWNTTGNPVALKIAMSNTASGATTKFLSCLAGASGTTEVFSVGKDGVVLGPNIANAFADTLETNSGFGFSSGNPLVQKAGTSIASALSSGWQVLALSLGATIGSPDTFAVRDAANTLALRNSTNAQAFHIYNTYTSGSVYERGFMRWVSNVLEIGTEHVGGVLRAMHLKGQNIEARFSSGNQFIVRNDATEVARFTGGNQLQFLNGGNILFVEATAPSAPSANQGVLFLQDNGAGKSQLCVRFNTGAIQVLSTEP